jgi:branched-chain amino acid transport system permease protein
MTGQTAIVGLIAGGIYGLLALGIVLVYRGSRVLNFAQGEIGTLSLYVASILVVDKHLPWWLGALAAVALAAVVGVGFEVFVVRRMGDASRLSVVVATVGLLLLLVAGEIQVFGPGPRSVPPPIGGFGVKVAGVFVSPTQLLALALTLALGLGLAALLRFTDFGLAVLAAAQDPTAVRLVGIRLSRVSAFTWGAGAAVSAVAALFIEPTVGVFQPGFASELFLYGLAAALVGGLSSLPGAFVGGLVVGELQAFVKAGTLSSGIAGLPVVAVFGLILVVLLARPQGLLGGKGAAA